MTKHTLIVTAAVFLLAGPSLAQTATRTPLAPPQAERADKMFERLDTNKDGKVALSEFQAGRGAQMMARLDADKDGKLSKDEFAEMRKGKAEGADAAVKKAGSKGQGKMWSKVDADNDGVLSKAELDGFLESRFKHMDADNDGALTMAELKPGAGRAKVGI